MEFSAAFAQLRKEKGFSQRQVAADLNISQALLSHYENGLREPRLDFVVRACEYYGVSSDYMLGRTSVRENPMLTGTGLARTGEGDALAELWVNGNMYSLINAVTVMMNMMVNIFGEPYANTAFDYLSMAAYKLFRYMRLDTDEKFRDALELPGYKFSILCDEAIKNVESELADIIHDNGSVPDTGYTDRVMAEYPAACGMFIDWLKSADAGVKSRTK